MASAALPHARRGTDKAGAKQLLDKVRSLHVEARAVESLVPGKQFGPPSNMPTLNADSSAVRKELDGLERTIQRIRKQVEGTGPAQMQFPDAARPLKSMISKNELLESARFADAMGWTRQALSKALASRRVFFVEHEGARYFPAFYADPKYERRHLESVTKTLGDLPGGSKLQFFSNARGSLDRLTPLEALLKGKLAAVQASAEAFAQG